MTINNDNKIRILSFLGLGIVFVLFSTTWYLSYQDCTDFNSNCPCTYKVLNLDIYLFTGFAFSIFFLLYCLLFLFNFSTFLKVKKTGTNKSSLDSMLLTSNYTIYQHPFISLLSKIGFTLSIGLFIFAYAILKIQCIPHLDCNATGCSNSITLGIDSYTLGYCTSGMYFTLFTFVALLKSYPSKYI